jgi:hypothetical protein
MSEINRKMGRDFLKKNTFQLLTKEEYEEHMMKFKGTDERTK